MTSTAFAGARTTIGSVLMLIALSAAKPQDTTRVAFDKPPEPRGGFAALQQAMVYPQSARMAGFEGKAVIEICISDYNELLDVKLHQSSGDSACDRAAIDAIRAVEWIAAKQGENPVTVTVLMPVQFKLNDHKPEEKPRP
jgi:protein TonB